MRFQYLEFFPYPVDHDVVICNYTRFLGEQNTIEDLFSKINTHIQIITDVTYKGNPIFLVNVISYTHLLNVLGEQGWELVNIYKGTSFILKKQIPNTV